MSLEDGALHHNPNPLGCHNPPTMVINAPNGALDAASVREAYTTIIKVINQTPLIRASGLSFLDTSTSTEDQRMFASGSTPLMDLYLKWEGMQKTGSSKYRGARYLLSLLQNHTLAKGLATTSSGITPKLLTEQY